MRRVRVWRAASHQSESSEWYWSVKMPIATALQVSSHVKMPTKSSSDASIVSGSR